MARIVCGICLRSGFDRAKDIDERLKAFHGELCYYDVSETEICRICEHQLRKFYNFRLKCRRAHIIIKNSASKHINLDALTKRMRPSLKFTTKTSQQKDYNTICIINKPTANSQNTDDELKENIIKMGHETTETDPLCNKQMKLENKENDSKPKNELSDDFELHEQNYLEVPYEQDLETDNELDTGLDNLNDIQVNKLKRNINDMNQKPNKIKKTIFKSQNKDLKEFELLIPKKEKSDIKDECIIELRDRIVRIIENGMIDLGENAITKEMFLEMFEKCDKSRLRGMLERGPSDMTLLKKFLLFLLKNYNPEYEIIFDIEYLNTREKKLAEFNSRKESKEFQNAKYKCDICYKVFETPTHLEYHNKWHEASRPHACDICSMRFLARKHLNVHNRTNHNSVYRCKLCRIIIYDVYAMRNHYEQHKGVKYTCDICLGEYSSKSTMISHRVSHSTVTCSLCARRFMSALGLTKHMKLKHPGAVSTESQECEARTKRKHTVMHQKNHIYQCVYPGCLERFSSAGGLRGHALTAGHMRRHAPADTENYKICPICEEKVLIMSSLSMYKHYTAAHPSEPYRRPPASEMLCELCGRGYVSPARFEIHRRTHTGERPFQCSLCPKSYTTLLFLQTHMRGHTGERPFRCSDCSKGFCDRVALMRHIRVHTGEKPYACPVCGKTFTQSNSVKRHVSTVHLKNKEPPRKRKHKTK